MTLVDPVEHVGEPGLRVAVAEEGRAFTQRGAASGPVGGVPRRARPDVAQAHFGPMRMFVGQDMAASAELTKEELDWYLAGPTLFDDLERL